MIYRNINKEQKILNKRIKKNIFISLLLSIFYYSAFSQINDSGLPDRTIVAEFDTNQYTLHEGEVVSNILKVINNNGEDHTFLINLTYPAQWKPLTFLNRTYTVSAEDTLFIPIRIIPMGKVKGNTKYLINAYIVSENNMPLTTAHFFITKPKISNWDMSILPSEKHYFLNGENTTDFAVNLFNKGNEEQEIILDAGNLRKDLILLDTTDKIIKKPHYETLLPPFGDTTFHFKMKYLQGVRNLRMVDIESHRPNLLAEPESYSIFMKSTEPMNKGIRKMKRVRFARLSNQFKANPYSSAVLPLRVEANIYNIMNAQPIMNLLFSGNTRLDNGALLNYYSQYYFSSYFANKQVLASSYNYLGYFDEKLSVQIGDVSPLGGSYGGIAGKGISASYSYLKNHKTSAYYIRSPRLFTKADRTGFGLAHQMIINKNRINVGYSHVNNSLSQLNTDYFNASTSMKINNNHSFGMTAVGSSNVSSNPTNQFSRFGYLLAPTYSGRYFNNRLQSNLGLTYYSKFFSPYNAGESYYINHFSNVKVNNKWNAQLLNNYSIRKLDYVLQTTPATKETFLNNQVSFSRKINKASIGPGAFYNISSVSNLTLHSRGLSLNYSINNYETNSLFSASLRGGYNRTFVTPKMPDYFFLQFYSFFKYRTLGMNVFYNYGTYSLYDRSFLQGGVYPQRISFALSYQYLFPNRHFVLNNVFNYSYMNTFRRHTFGFTPDLYYFTDSGWRFLLNMGFYLSSSNANQGRIYDFGQESKATKAAVSKSLNMSVGVRKEFGIPIPWSKSKYHTLDFVAFVDLDGNNIKDNDEIVLENVVIKVGEWEVLTDAQGKATLRNIKDTNYTFTAFSLVDIKGYYPNMDETILVNETKTIEVPFVKGVKLYGDVFFDRETLAPGGDHDLNLSNIKITAMNGKAIHTLTNKDGSFMFYVPFGKYVISMDEKILGDRFRLLQNNIELELDKTTESLSITFYVVERRRKINVKRFNGNGKVVKGSENSVQPQPKTLEELKREETTQPTPSTRGTQTTPSSIEEENDTESLLPNESFRNETFIPSSSQRPINILADYYTLEQILSEGPIDKSQIKFKVQVGIYKNRVPVSMTKRLLQLGYVETGYTSDGMVRYTSGSFNTYSDAKKHHQELRNQNYTDAFIIGEYKWKTITAQDALELLKR